MEVLHQPEDIIEQRYRILSILGKGGIGTTYAAENLQTGERVALKVVSLRGANDPKVLELFEREARILSQLNHPGIPRYLDYFQVKKRRNSYFYLAQQLVEGKSLAELVENGWQPQEVEVWHIANQILDILVYLQQFTPPVIHRDIKPQNILRRSDGKVFLVDFGAVQDVYHGTLTGGSTVAGTYGYMAPEQFRGKTVLATDLYGLGATLIFLLTQKSPADLPKQKLKIDFRPHVRVTKRFADWLERMIEPIAEDRFRSAGEAVMVWQGKNDLSSYMNLEASELDKIQSWLKTNSSLPSGCIVRRANPRDKYKLAQLINSDKTVDLHLNNSRLLLRFFLQCTGIVIVGFLLIVSTIILFFILTIFLMILVRVLINFLANLTSTNLIEFLVKLLIFCPVAYLSLVAFFKLSIYPLLGELCLIMARNTSIFNCWVIESNKKLIAFGTLNEIDNNLYINQLFVEKPWRRKGLASALVKRFIQENTSSVYVCVSIELVQFYSRLGFIQADSPSYGHRIKTMVYPKK